MKARYLYPNLISSAGTLITVSTEDVAYPRANLFCERQGKPFKFTGNISQSITLDFGAAKRATAITIFNHNFTTNASISIKANSINDFTSPPFSQVLSASEKNASVYFDATYRYWRLDVNDPSNLAPLRIGELVLGVYREFPYYLYQSQFTDSDLAVQHETEFGQHWNYQLTSRRAWQLQFSTVTDTDLAAIKAVKRELGGPAHPFAFWPDGANPDFYYVRMRADLQSKGTFFNSNEIQVDLAEDPIGILL